MVEYVVYHIGYIPVNRDKNMSYNLIDYQIKTFIHIFDAEEYVNKLIEDGRYESYELAIFPRYRI